VDKIANGGGSGSVGGNLFGVYGSSSTDTEPVNNCNDCGHQWKKSERYNLKIDNIIYSIFNDLAGYIKGEKYSWMKKRYEDLKDYHAETLYRLNHETCNEYSSSRLSLETLRKYFKSIYGDDEYIKIE
jgi:hypothetical protein